MSRPASNPQVYLRHIGRSSAVAWLSGVVQEDMVAEEEGYRLARSLLVHMGPNDEMEPLELIQITWNSGQRLPVDFNGF